MFFFVSSKPTHDVENFVLIDIDPKFHPFSDVEDATLFNVWVKFFAVIFDILIDELFQMVPVHTDISLEKTDIKECFELRLQ